MASEKKSFMVNWPCEIVRVPGGYIKFPLSRIAASIRMALGMKVQFQPVKYRLKEPANV